MWCMTTEVYSIVCNISISIYLYIVKTRIHIYCLVLISVRLVKYLRFRWMTIWLRRNRDGGFPSLLDDPHFCSNCKLLSHSPDHLRHLRECINAGNDDHTGVTPHPSELGKCALVTAFTKIRNLAIQGPEEPGTGALLILAFS